MKNQNFFYKNLFLKVYTIKFPFGCSFLSLFHFYTILLIMKKNQQRGKTLQIMFKNFYIFTR